MSLRYQLLITAHAPPHAELLHRALNTTEIHSSAKFTFVPHEDLGDPAHSLGNIDLILATGSPDEAHTALKRALAAYPAVPVLAFASELKEEWITRSFRAGACEYVTGEHPERLEPAIQRLLHPARAPVNGTGTPFGEAPRADDGTRLRAALAEISRLKHVLDQHVIVATTDRRGRITSANDKFCQLSGYTRDELLGQDHRILNSGAHPKAFFRELWATIGRGGIWRGEIRNRAKDGTHYWVDTVIIPQLDADGKPFEHIAIRTDITRLKSLEGSLERARDEAMEASRLKSEFMANMSHEIRTPMNGIIGMSHLLLQMSLDEEERHMAGIIESSAESLLTIINDILDFSRIEAGKMRMDFADFDLHRLIQDTLEILRPSAEKKNLSLRVKFDDGPRETFHGDPGRIRQVLTNLVGNAIKFTASGAVTVEVQLRTECEDRRIVRVNVRDTGPGIPFPLQKRLFEPFVQADGSLTREHGGTGLGLSISHRIVELMDGSMGLESEPGRGSVFWFELDLPIRDAAKGEAIRGSERHVLIVDDNATNREIMSRQLANHGVRTTTANDAMSALAPLTPEGSTPTWDLIILDHHMPRISGIDLARAIRSDPALADTPLVMLSSGGAVEIDEVLDLGFAAILTKPVREQQLHRIILNCFADRDREAEKHLRRRPNLGKLSVLLAEDHPSNQAVATKMIERLGHRVTVVANGADALARLQEESFDAILMDCQMPVVDGFEATRQIRTGKLPGLDPETPIIALTAHALPQDRIRCLECGMNAYVTKPLRPHELELALAQCVRASEVASSAAPEREAGSSSLLDARTVECLRQFAGARRSTLFEDVAIGFLEDAPKSLRRLRQFRADKDSSKIVVEAHRLGNTAASVGALSLRETCGRLEDAGNRDDFSRAAECITVAEHQTRSIERHLRELGITEEDASLDS